MRRAAAFSGPMAAAIGRVNDRSFRADGPTFLRVNKLHVKKVLFDTRFLFDPGAAAVRRAIDAAGAANGPTNAIIEERSRGETNTFFHARQRRLIPRVTAVGSLNDRRTRADYPTAIVVDKRAAEQQAPRRRTQTRPRLTGIARREDRPRFAK